MTTMRWLVAGAAAGYLVGSISSARFLARFVAPDEDLSSTVYPIDHEASLVSHGVSPAALGARAGATWGGLAALLDASKAFVVTRAATHLAPSGSAHAVAAVAGTAAVVGHVYPVYHGFAGGFGQSPILGSALALDWVSVPVTTTASLGLGVAVGDQLVALEGWPALMVPFALWRRDRALLAWSLAVNAVYWVRMAPEARQRLDHYRAHRPPWRERVAAIFEEYV